MVRRQRAGGAPVDGAISGEAAPSGAVAGSGARAGAKNPALCGTPHPARRQHRSGRARQTGRPNGRKTADPKRLLSEPAGFGTHERHADAPSSGGALPSPDSHGSAIAPHHERAVLSRRTANAFAGTPPPVADRSRADTHRRRATRFRATAKRHARWLCGSRGVWSRPGQPPPARQSAKRGVPAASGKLPADQLSGVSALSRGAGGDARPTASATAAGQNQPARPEHAGTDRPASGVWEPLACACRRRPYLSPASGATRTPAENHRGAEPARATQATPRRPAGTAQPLSRPAKRAAARPRPQRVRRPLRANHRLRTVRRPMLRPAGTLHPPRRRASHPRHHPLPETPARHAHHARTGTRTGLANGRPRQPAGTRRHPRHPAGLRQARGTRRPRGAFL
ncbi:hypothetical protein HRbin14_02305 [bacterium HR14]|nr:hypothetical protein HRbin14_02305 [bacterium HR14]